MMGDLNTFIQYLAALYFTICIDGAFFKRFWSPDYYNLVQDIIEHYKFNHSQVLKDELDEAIKKRAHLLETHSVRRGVFVLLVCVFFMIYSAFEEISVEPEDVIEKSIPLFGVCVCASIVILLSNYFFTKWRWVILNIGIIAIVFVILEKYVFVIKTNYLEWDVVGFTKIYIVILLPLPIVYQLYVNWLYSQAYVQHLISTLNNEYERYLKTQKAMRTHDKNLCDSVYQWVFSDSYFDNNGQDMVITNFNQAVLNRLIAACTPPSPCVLIKKWFVMKSKDYDMKKIETMENDYNFNDNNEVIPKEKVENGIGVIASSLQNIGHNPKTAAPVVTKGCGSVGRISNNSRKSKKRK